MSRSVVTAAEKFLIAFTAMCWVCAPLVQAQDENDFSRRRQAMVAEIEADVVATRFYLDKQELDTRVMEAMATVPRHEFVPESQRRYAYANRPLPIGHGQTISQPYIVALMTDLIDPGPDDVVLEIGTGSGYQAAILAELVNHVYSIEIIEELANQAKEGLARLG